jgi:hypothetical protein
MKAFENPNRVMDSSVSVIDSWFPRQPNTPWGALLCCFRSMASVIMNCSFFAFHYDLERRGVRARPFEFVFGLIKGISKSIDHAEATSR